MLCPLQTRKMLKILSFLIKELPHHKIDMKNYEVCSEVQTQAYSLKSLNSDSAAIEQ